MKFSELLVIRLANSGEAAGKIIATSCFDDIEQDAVSTILSGNSGFGKGFRSGIQSLISKLAERTHTDTNEINYGNFLSNFFTNHALEGPQSKAAQDILKTALVEAIKKTDDTSLQYAAKLFLKQNYPLFELGTAAIFVNDLTAAKTVKMGYTAAGMAVQKMLDTIEVEDLDIKHSGLNDAAAKATLRKVVMDMQSIVGQFIQEDKNKNLRSALRPKPAPA